MLIADPHEKIHFEHALPGLLLALLGAGIAGFLWRLGRLESRSDANAPLSWRRGASSSTTSAGRSGFNASDPDWWRR